MINVGIIGSGFIGPAHIEAIRRLGFVNVVALCDSTLELAQEKSRQLAIPHAYGDVDALLEHPGLDVVHNCTPNYLHAAINRKAMLAGKHIFSEKPLCMTSEEARELVALAQEKGIVHGVSFVYRHFAMVQQAASMIRQETLGRLFAVHGGYLQDWMLYETDYNWRVDAAKGGLSRTVADIGSHWCDTIQFVTGRKIVEVMADLATVYPTRKASRHAAATFGGADAAAEYEDKPVTTEDFAAILLRFDDGSRGSLTVSQVSAGRKNRLHFEINGGQASLAWDQELPQHLWIGQRDRPNQLLCDDPGLMNADVSSQAHFPGGHIEGWPDAFKNMMLRFYTYLREGKQPQVAPCDFATFHDGAAIMFIIDAIVRSHQEQRWVAIPA
ncbi:D-xylose dehydrogenase [Dickeya dianthicola]|uniref:Gfo/Idh/MocA family oxidoreductase n=1 Tax=Dickeya dianthicola TaxID=204039 RepID=A0AAP2GA65_9GAMM|nr:Gfo/Idh/MocA family oxidoreductase [Dickeya dianthicola]ATO34089.1 Nucleoside-diphosphate-sugar epimerase [Dickeya dianthicola RNS04.9]AYC20027.1 D-xylose dehydrogenase [Dickeya dianthicola]MBI0437076.1 Gfo/Idh/MocA family oxidoreductase [Dickeya dianthicola]MBI0448965.1 Gfo/Idh/MocA family oxidoreductase [Dickeya dianthicola]MBI0452037.1 Gfo/Idh/MocA family oxidoreductase [Dickeya dianthicola]